MAFSFQPLKYGWVALASLGILTGVTIYVTNNQRHQVKPEDIIEIVLGVQERCLAAQTGTNPIFYWAGNRPVYSISPLSFIRNWLEGTTVVAQVTNTINGTNYVFTITNFACVTNTITNAIGWHLDRAMIVELDAKIKELLYYYSDPNMIYDGTTNIATWPPPLEHWILLTQLRYVSAWGNSTSPVNTNGLFDQLGVGKQIVTVVTNDDGDTYYWLPGGTVVTNYIWQFTRTPCRTNAIQTNWVVNYTNLQGVGYWGMTGVWSTIITNIGGTNYYEAGYYNWYSGGLSNIPISYTAADYCASIWVVTNVDKATRFFYRYTNVNELGPFIADVYNEYPSPNKGYYISNFPQIVQTVTNTATYGEYPWQIYIEDLQERYKVLNAFQYTVPSYPYESYNLMQFVSCTGFSRTVSMSSNNTDTAGLTDLKKRAIAAFTNAPVAEAQTPCAYTSITRSGTAPTNLNWTVTLKRSYGVWQTMYDVSTNVVHERPQAYVRGRVSSSAWTFDNQGDNVNSTSSYTLSAQSQESDIRTRYTIIVGSANLPAPSSWPVTPSSNTTIWKGYLTDATDRKVVIPWNFSYCTNKYW
jgi:hypothetical protein